MPTPGWSHLPGATWSLAPHRSMATMLFDAEKVVRTLDDEDFALLLRAVDLVVLSQAFSTLRLQYALRLERSTALHLTAILQLLDIVGSDERDGQREVHVDVEDLSLVVTRLLEARASVRRADGQTRHAA